MKKSLFLLVIILQSVVMSFRSYAIENLPLHYIPTNDSVRWARLTPKGDIVIYETKFGPDSVKMYFHRVSDGMLLGESVLNKLINERIRLEDNLLVSHLGAIDVVDYQTGKTLWSKGDALQLLKEEYDNLQYWPQDGSFVHPVFWNDSVIVCLKNDYKKGASVNHFSIKEGWKFGCVGYSAKTGQVLWEKNFTPNDYLDFLGETDGSKFFCRNNKFAYRKYCLLDLASGELKSQTLPIFDHQVLVDYQYIADHLFLVEMNMLKCFDSNMDVVWRAHLPQGKMSSCSLHTVGDTLVLVNYGSANRKRPISQLVPCGKPFVAAFDMKSGKRLFLKKLSQSKECFYSVVVSPQKVSALSLSHMANVYLSDGHKEEMQYHPVSKSNPYILTFNDLYSINEGHNYFVRLGEGFDCVLDKNMNSYRYFGDSDPRQIASHATLYSVRHTLENGNLCIQGGADDGDCWVITPEGKPLYHVPESGRYISGKKNTILFLSHEGMLGYCQLK